MRFFTLFFCSILLMTSCDYSAPETKNGKVVKALDGTDSPREKLATQVMAIHDSVMPKMDNIMKLKMRLKASIDTTNSDTFKLAALNAINQLEIADEQMMQWMRNYNPPADSIPEQEAMSYLKDQEKKIIEVQNSMLSSIRNAKVLLDETK